MPIDRDATIRSAEKLLRQGRLDAAIAEYARLAADQPNDWASLNALGDLYVRAGRPDRAADQFARVGDHLLREGSLSKAIAVYKKMLRIIPGEPRAMRGLAIIAGQQPEPAASRTTPAAPPEDPDAMVEAARQVLDAADVQRGCELLVAAADLYEAHGRGGDALSAVAEASDADPANALLRGRMLRTLLAQGEVALARHIARVVPELLMVADAYDRLGRRTEALDVIAEAAEFDPANASLRGRVVREFAAAGEVDRARRLARTPAEVLLVAEALTSQGRGAEVLDMVAAALEREPHDAALREQLVTGYLAQGAVDRAAEAARSSREWQLIAGAHRQAGRVTEALDAMRQAASLDPHNVALHAGFVQACLDAGDFDRATQAARTTAEILAVADAIEARGDTQAALAVRAEALRRDPADPLLRVRLIREYVRAGERDRAHALLTLETAGDDPELLVLLARLEFGIDRVDEGRRVLNRLLAARGDRRGDLMTLSCELADENRLDAAYVCAELFADTAAVVGDWGGAAGGLQEFVTRVPQHVPALVKLVEVCVDGGLDETMRGAQAQLAEAYIAAGQAREARVIAEDLVLREPWARAHVDRCRRALALGGETHPDRAIADLLSDDGPFSLEDVV